MLRSDTSLHILTSEDIWVGHIAEFIFLKALESVRERGRFTICLAGGGTPARVYERLANWPYKLHFPWKNTIVFWGDERCVPADHIDSNYGMANAALLQKVPIPTSQLYPMDGTLDPTQSALNYEATLFKQFGNESSSFDLTVLGLGDDGHTASLFPNTDILSVEDKMVSSVFLASKKVYRLSLTAPIINRSRHIIFLVKGGNKHSALREVLQGSETPSNYPAKLIHPNFGQLHWFLDRAAAEGLTL